MIADLLRPLGPDLLRLAVIIPGLILGYAAGRLLWETRHLTFAPFPIIAAVAIVGLVSSRLFAAAGLDGAWMNAFFPLVVSFAAGFSITRARPPLESRWWQVWRT